MYHTAKKIKLLYAQKLSNIFLRISKSSNWLFVYIPRIKWHPKSVSRRESFLDRQLTTQLLIAEVMEEPQVSSLLHSSDGEVFSEIFGKIDDFIVMMQDPSKNHVNNTSQMSKCMNVLGKFEKII